MLARAQRYPMMTSLKSLLLPWMFALASAGCSAPDAGRTPDPTKPHHTAQGYRNTDGTVIDVPLSDVLKFYWEMAGVERPDPPADLRPLVPDLGFLQRNRQDPSVTWIGHATTLVQLGGVNILIDPQFSERASPVTWFGPQRRVSPALSVSELPPIDLVLISHSHYDHLDEASVRQLEALHHPRFIVPLGVDALVRQWGVQQVQAMDWGEQRVEQASTGGAVEIHCVPAHHWSKRSLNDANRTLWAGFVMRSGDKTFYYSGDTGYSADFVGIGEKFGPIDLAILPVGAYEPRWFMKAQHVNEAEAVQIHQDVRAKQSIGVHWGTFELALEAIDAPRTGLPKAVAQAGLQPGDFTVMRMGETRTWREVPVADVRGAPGSSPDNPKRQWARGEPR